MCQAEIKCNQPCLQNLKAQKCTVESFLRVIKNTKEVRIYSTNKEKPESLIFIDIKQKISFKKYNLFSRVH